MCQCFVHAMYVSFKGFTHRATEVLRWLSMSTYRCIKTVCRSVGTLFPCDGVYSSKWLSTEIAILDFQLNSNMFNIFLSMGMLFFQI